MKKVTKILMIVVLATFGFKSFAQTEAGRVLVAGESSLNFSFMKDKVKDDDNERDGPKHFNLEFTPQAGYFVIDNLAVGVALPIQFSTLTVETDEGDYKEKESLLAFAPFARYYFGASNIKPFLQGAVGFGSSNQKTEPVQGETVENKSSVFLWDITGGIGIFLNDNVSLDIGASYASVSLKPKENNENNARMISSGLGLSLGFTIAF